MESQDDVLTSTNYLGTLMMKQTNLELTDFEDYQLMLMEDIQAMNHQGYVNSDGEMVSWDDATENVKKEELEYEYLQYNALVESSKRIDWFFTLGEDEK